VVNKTGFTQAQFKYKNSLFEPSTELYDCEIQISRYFR